MTKIGNSKDNPESERINNTIKNELLKDKEFHNIEEVIKAMTSAVSFYNKECPHLEQDVLTVDVKVIGNSQYIKLVWRMVPQFFCNFAPIPGFRYL